TKTFCEREREREYTVLQDVGLGASFRGGGVVHTPNTGFVDSDSRQKQMRRVWQLSNEWSFHSGSFRPLFCSHLYLFVSRWSPHVPRRIIPRLPFLISHRSIHHDLYGTADLCFAMLIIQSFKE
ncbi:hypothetical protein TorRG33x02_089140, partial [Trema orientale]